MMMRKKMKNKIKLNNISSVKMKADVDRGKKSQLPYLSLPEQEKSKFNKLNMDNSAVRAFMRSKAMVYV